MTNTEASRATDPFPPELDIHYYRSIHADIWHLSDEDVRCHYLSKGKREGRKPNALASREMFRDLAVELGRILEIGPFTRPLFSGPNVKYFDVLNRDGLADLAVKIELYETDQIPDIDYVSATGDLTIIPEAFDVVASSHAIEHQPDLVRHLKNVQQLLRPGGFYFLWIPDKRYCLDHFLPESTIADVLDAAAEGRKFHTFGSLIKQEVFRSHNDSRRHWLGDHGQLPENPAALIREIGRMYSETQKRGEYVDRHAWQFTPDSFRAIIELLNELGLTELCPLRVYQSMFPSNEFWAILRHSRSHLVT